MRKLPVLASLLFPAGSLGVAAVLAGSSSSFGPARDYPTGHTPVWVAIGDLTGDGKPDLATANAEASTLSVLLNSGDGSFGSKVDSRTGFHPTAVAIGDLNGDGKPDLVTANHGSDDVVGKTVSVLL